jgi:putative transposase
MRDWRSLSHVRWDCKYHVVFVPKYRKKALYGKTRKHIGEILHDLCRQKGVELLDGHSMPDHMQFFWNRLNLLKIRLCNSAAISAIE